MATSPAPVLEIVVFTLKPGAAAEDLLATAEPVSAWIGQQPGFVSRELFHDVDGERWIDLVGWATLEDARAAADRALQSESCAPMFALVEMESALMLHGERATPALRA